MSNKLDITKGEWKSHQQNSGDMYISSEDWFNFIKVSFVHDANTENHREQCLNNSKLICDAGNTYNQTPLLPSELLRQRNELIEVLNHLGSCLSGTIYYKLSELCYETLTQIENE